MKPTLSLIAVAAVILSIAWACNAADDTNSKAAVPQPNPVHLESLEHGQPPVPPSSATKADPKPGAPAAKPTAPPPKPVGLVVYGATLFQINGQPIWVIPERYLFDMTNTVYKGHYQVIDKVALPEP